MLLFLPVLLPGQSDRLGREGLMAVPQVVIVGGGYAGLAAATRLVRGGVGVTLLDRREAFLDRVGLHHCVNAPLADLLTPYGDLARRHGFAFRRMELPLDEARLIEWRWQGRVVPGDPAGVSLPFDYLVIATGSTPILLGDGDGDGRVIHQSRIEARGLAETLNEYLTASDPRRRAVTVVGGGATGTQFLFELDDWLRTRHQRCPLNWVFREARPLAEFPPGFARYVEDKLRGRRGTIAVYPHTAFQGQEGERVVLAGSDGKSRRPSGLTLLFPGLKPVAEFQADIYGRLWLDGEARPNLWGVGDGVRFPGGFDALTAQAALRKGWRVADNILAQASGRSPTPYDYRPGGYFVSLGYGDGVGWLASRNLVVSGLAAQAIKEVSETALGLWLGTP